MEKVIRRLVALTDPLRVASLTCELLKQPSPTRQTGSTVQWLSQYLRAAGFAPKILTDLPEGPSLVVDLPGDETGPTLTILGHLDHKPLDHVPSFQENGCLYGRGAASAKSGVAAAIEALLVLRAAGMRHHGRLVLAFHTLHEYPLGRQEGLEILRQNGYLGDTILCVDGPHTHLPIVGKGSAAFDLSIRQGESRRESYEQHGHVNPIVDGRTALEHLFRWGEQIGRVSWPLIGPDTLHVGSIHAGDWHDRVPGVCHITGVRRFGPQHTEYQILAELDQLRREIQARTNAQIDLRAEIIGPSYTIRESEPLVEAVKQAFRLVTGLDLPTGGYQDIGDANKTAGEMGIPTVYHGTNRERVDAELEWVNLKDVVRASRVYLAAIFFYLGFTPAVENARRPARERTVALAY